MANLVIDIGNTALKAAWCDGMTLGKTFRYQGERMMEYILSLVAGNKPETVVLSSVRYFSDADLDLLKAKCDKLLIVDSDILEKYGLPSYMTPDRAASIIAARYLFKGKGTVIFDFGIVLTIDFLDENGEFEGGNISPGYRTRFRSLNRYSRNLPLVDSPETINDKGYDLKSSIESGVISGMEFEIMGYICRYPEKTVVFTGGDAIYFAKRMKNSIFVVCNLVLMGLALIALEYDKKD